MTYTRSRFEGRLPTPMHRLATRVRIPANCAALIGRSGPVYQGDLPFHQPLIRILTIGILIVDYPARLFDVALDDSAYARLFAYMTGRLAYSQIKKV